MRLRSLPALFLVPAPLPNPFSLVPYLRFRCSALVWFFNLRPVQFALSVLSQAHNLLFFPSSVFVGIWKLKKGRVQSGTHAALCRYGCPGFVFVAAVAVAVAVAVVVAGVVRCTQQLRAISLWISFCLSKLKDFPLYVPLQPMFTTTADNYKTQLCQCSPYSTI